MSESRSITLGQINEITTRINSEEEITSLLSIIMDTARDLLDTEGASLLLHDEPTGELVFNVISGESNVSLREKRIPAGEGIAGECALNRHAVIVNDASKDARLFKDIDEQINFNTRNILAVPMIARETLIGVLETVNTVDGRKFSGKDIRLLSYLANMAALAIQNRRLINDLNIRVDELNCLYEISQAMQRNDSIEEILSDVLNTVHNVLKVNRLSVVIEDDHEFQTPIIHTLGFSISEEEKINIRNHEGILGKVYREGIPLLVSDYLQDLEYVPEFADRYATRSFISVPIRKDGRVVGVISVADKKSAAPFDQFELKVLTTVASQLAESLFRFQARKREAELAVYRKDIQTAAEIQRNSLPSIPSRLSGLQIGSRYESCREVGGDFYDLIYHNEDRISFLIADVAGKGVPAALFMEYSKTLLAGLIPRYLDPVSSLRAANEEIYSNSRIPLFVTMMIVQVEREFRRLRIASAGHNRQILYRAREKEIVEMSAKGTPLGAFSGTEYIENVVSYDPDDLIVLYTDGVTEAEGVRDLDFFGEERLFEAIKELGDQEPEEIIEGVLERIRDFGKGREPSDDTTILVVRL